MSAGTAVRYGVVAAAVAALLCVSSCGESKDQTPLDVLRSFNSALASGDGERACELLTDRRRQQVTDDASAFQRDCAETLGGLSEPGNPNAESVKALDSAQLGPATITGDTATVEVDAPPFGATTAQLQLQGSVWRVSESAAGF